MSANLFQHISEVVKYHRKRSGLTQRQLAEFAGVGKTAIFDIEHGKTTVQLETLVQVFKVLNISVTLDSPLMTQMEKKDE